MIIQCFLIYLGLLSFVTESLKNHLLSKFQSDENFSSTRTNSYGGTDESHSEFSAATNNISKPFKAGEF